jgi:hypothetical protein
MRNFREEILCLLRQYRPHGILREELLAAMPARFNRSAVAKSIATLEKSGAIRALRTPTGRIRYCTSE